ncbi:MAG: SagB/ThcOx family dehydrogenase [Thermoanaerobacteraceae bacterium]|nr:SagB/ThcOx family dehydrogenase [Thermoanaerobacteraceae bacterium]
MDGIGKEFIEKTKYKYLGKSDQAKNLPQPTLELKAEDNKKIIELPHPKDIEVSIKLVEAMENRRSLRRYSDKLLSLEELSFLLRCTQGVKQKSHNVTFRMVPSAGARHAFETYILANKVKGLNPGIYRYLALEHKLQEIETGNEMAAKLVNACLGQTFIKNSAVTFIWVAVSYRMTWRYGERGYRYMFLDAGHVAQNLYLSAEGIDCGTCVIGAYDDDAVNELLGIDGKGQFVIYLAAVGKKTMH